jgi:hypothetical protein
MCASPDEVVIDCLPLKRALHQQRRKTNPQHEEADDPFEADDLFHDAPPGGTGG